MVTVLFSTAKIIAGTNNSKNPMMVKIIKRINNFVLLARKDTQPIINT
jgi:hypothetical protein